VPNTTPVRYLASSVGLAAVPANLQGAVNFPEHAEAVQITNFDTTETDVLPGRVQRRVQRRWVPHAEGRCGRAAQREQRRQGVPPVDAFKSSGTRRSHSSVPGVGSGRGAFGYYTVDNLGTSG
jgi:hypothetical protein